MNALTFTALAEPNRLRIIELLRMEPCSVNQVAQRLNLRQPQVSKHLHTLSKVGLVTVSPIAQQRMYALSPTPFLQLEDWVASFHRYWNPKLTNLESYLQKRES